MIKDSFIANRPFIKPSGVKNLSNFISTLNSKKFSVLNVWADGSWSVTQKNTVIKINSSESPIISLNISYCQDLEKENLTFLADEINTQLTQIQKNLLLGS